MAVLPTIKIKAQRQAEEEARIHDLLYSDVIEALWKAGIDPDRLHDWLAGPRK